MVADTDLLAGLADGFPLAEQDVSSPKLVNDFFRVIPFLRHGSDLLRWLFTTFDLDQKTRARSLRGALHRFDAVRGTIITTGGFSKGTTEAAFEPGAAPITLISGEKLLDLLIEHGIGVKKRVTETWELDPEAFSGDA
ncbi:MAG: restriction endonuclease, partial [Myxococcales bacterium]|nr:restriction endonuclease [Myxococcales bacterium]